MAMEIKKFGFFFLLGIILLLALKFYAIAEAFFPALASAAVLAYLCNPIYLWFARKTHQRTLSAFGVILMVFTMIIVPFTLMVFAVQRQILFLLRRDTYDRLLSVIQGFDATIYNKFNVRLSDYYMADVLPRLMTSARDAITAYAPQLIYSLTGLILYGFITLFMLYYLLRNSRKVVDVFKSYFPLSEQNCALLLRRMGNDTRTLVLGQFLVSALQGALGGLGFFAFGISGAVFWGFAMMLLAFIPFMGTGLVWVPACFYLAAEGNYGSAAGLFIWGALVVGTVDNIIRPKLTSTLGKLHPVTVLLGVFIGLKEWGFIGLVIGPLIISVLIELIRMFREEYIIE